MLESEEAGAGLFIVLVSFIDEYCEEENALEV